jgi:hypothetical protein
MFQSFLRRDPPRRIDARPPSDEILEIRVHILPQRERGAREFLVEAFCDHGDDLHPRAVPQMLLQPTLTLPVGEVGQLPLEDYGQLVLGLFGFLVADGEDDAFRQSVDAPDFGVSAVAECLDAQYTYDNSKRVDI